MANEVTDKNIGEVIKKPAVLIDFWAPWCMPCRMVAPVLDDLSEELKDKVYIGKLNVDDNHSTASKYGVMSIPTMIFFRNGEQVDSVVGALPKAQLKAFIEKNLK